MSYDFWLEVDTGGDEPHHIEPEALDGSYGNYTSNVSPIWARCLTEALKEHTPFKGMCGADARRDNRQRRPGAEPRPVDRGRLCLRDLIGLRAAGLAPLLRTAVKWGEEHRAELEPLAPANGWGDVEGALRYLGHIASECEKHPFARLGISS